MHSLWGPQNTLWTPPEHRYMWGDIGPLNCLSNNNSLLTELDDEVSRLKLLPSPHICGLHCLTGMTITLVKATLIVTLRSRHCMFIWWVWGGIPASASPSEVHFALCTEGEPACGIGCLFHERSHSFKEEASIYKVNP